MSIVSFYVTLLTQAIDPGCTCNYLWNIQREREREKKTELLIDDESALLGAAAAVGTLFNIGMNTANAVNLATVRRHVGEIQAEMLGIRQQLIVQSHALQTFGKSLNGTITILNTNSTLLNQTVKSINKLFSVVQNDLAQTTPNYPHDRQATGSKLLDR